MKKSKVFRLLVAVLLTVVVLVVPAFAEEAGGVLKLPIDLTPIVQALITVFAAIITLKVIPWIKARTSVDQQAAVGIITRTLVYAAEQIYGSGTGKKKLMYVKSRLKERGYDIDLDVIEAAVRELSIEESPVVIEPETGTGDALEPRTEPPIYPANPAK